MNRRSILFTSLFSLCLLAPIGCAVQNDDASEETASDSEELTASAHKLVGHYYAHAPAFGGFGRLALESNGRYDAEVDPAGTALCIKSPCLLPESGRWNAYKLGSTLKLRVKPTGQPARIYEVSKFDASVDFTSGIVLKRAGKTETLDKLGANQCLDSKDCKATEECGPKLCLMYCAVGDPFCCGPSTCQPRQPKKICGGFAGIACAADEECVDDPSDSCDPAAGGADCSGICVKKNPPPPPPPPSCWGAWLDNNGLCRTPADGVYPDSCCAGKTNPCGPAKCGVGTTCCNSLTGICTPPGMVCAF